MRIASRLLCTLLFCLPAFAIQNADAKPAEPRLPASIAEKTARIQKLPGFFPLYWDAQAGKLWLEIDKLDTEFLYLDALPAGIGSNDIGLDRGQLGPSRLVRFERSGPRVLLVQMNYDYRSSSSSATERRSVQQAFAQSVLWGFDVAAEEGGRVLVDATNFFLQDVHDVIGTLKRTRQGSYKLEPSRSAFYLPSTKNFPRNTEVEVILTFTGDEPGAYVRQVTPEPKSITVRQRHSFIQLPEPGFKTRAFDPRAGFFGPQFMDYSTPIGQPIMQRLIARHRLEKKDPAAAVSDAVEPIIYYLDPGTPEPVRSALLEGARWWNQAFEAAGYRNAFRVEMLPDDADPIDARYNVIQWVHRSTRGWSYGAAIVDPRTGEIIKGHVTLGSLRVRQDFMIAEGLLAPYESGKPADPRMLEMALARLRQLSAHEVGHTLGLQHNYIASVSRRASVMDYPHPYVTLGADGSPEMTQAYASGIGEWDKIAIAYGYSDFAPGAQEAPALSAILEDGRKRGFHYLTDQDARPTGSSHPLTHLWDNGANPVDELDRVLQVRARALDRFGENNIPPGTPLALLEDVLVPIYLYHRYQTEAAVKVLGGRSYTYAVRGDGQTPTTPVAPELQRRALRSVLRTIAPETLAIPSRIASLIPPRPEGFDRTRELFKSHAGLTFDSLAAAEAAANLSLPLLLDPARASRMVEQHARDSTQPGFHEVLDELTAATWNAPRKPGLLAEVQRAVENVALYHLMSLAASETALPQVRAMAGARLAAIAAKAKTPQQDSMQLAHLRYAAEQVAKFREDPAKVLKAAPPLDSPPGAPIGSFACEQ